MPRLFIAAWPTPAVAETLASIPTDDSEGVRMVPPANWHVTLRFLGDAESGDVVDRLRSAALPAATAVLGPSLRLLGPRQVVVPVDGVDRLAAAVRRATADLGDPPRRTFTGHLTVARLRRGATSSLPGTTVDDRFGVAEVALVESTLTSDGAVYSTVATFPTVRSV